MVDVDSKFGTFLNTREIDKNRDVRVRHGDVLAFGVNGSEFRLMLVDVVVFVPAGLVQLDVKFCRRTNSVDEAMYILLGDVFEVTMELAKAIATGKTVINCRYLGDCVREGQLLDDASYRMTFPKVDLVLRCSPAHTFLSFFGVGFEEGAGVVIGESTLDTWISEGDLLRACLLGEQIQLNEPPVRTLVPDSDSESDGIPQEPLTGDTGKMRESGASHALMTHQLASLCRPPQGQNMTGTSSNSGKSVKRFVKNVPVARRRQRGLHDHHQHGVIHQGPWSCP